MKKEVFQYFTNVSSKYKKNQKGGIWSIIRRYELKQIKKNILPELLGDKRVLELGAGSGGLTSFLLNELGWEVVAVDIIVEMLAEIPNDDKLEKRVADIESIKSISDFDIIISFGAFEFLENPIEVLKEYILNKEKKTAILLVAPMTDWRGQLYHFFHPAKSFDLRLMNFEEVMKLENLGVSLIHFKIYPFNSMIIIK